MHPCSMIERFCICLEFLVDFLILCAWYMNKKAYAHKNICEHRTHS
jgi:hypothetical protein